MATAIGNESGLSTFIFDLDGLVPSASLPTGHQYILKPVFRTSLNGGEDIYLEEEYYPVQLVEASSVNNWESRDKIKITNGVNGVLISLTEVGSDAEISVFDLAGKQVYFDNTSSNEVHLDNAQFKAPGIYVVSVKTNALHRVEKVSFMIR